MLKLIVTGIITAAGTMSLGLCGLYARRGGSLAEELRRHQREPGKIPKSLWPSSLIPTSMWPSSSRSFYDAAGWSILDTLQESMAMTAAWGVLGSALLLYSVPILISIAQQHHH
jgi:hypothetical protein